MYKRQAETREDVRHAMTQEFNGIFAQSRLVTGKGAVQTLGPDTALVTQRYVVTGAVDETGADLPRFAALLVAVLRNQNDAWQAISLTFNAVASVSYTHLDVYKRQTLRRLRLNSPTSLACPPC